MIVSGQTQGSAPTTPFAFNCPDAVVVVGQVAHFNLTPEAFLCRGFNFLPFVLSGSTEEPDLHTNYEWNSLFYVLFLA